MNLFCFSAYTLVDEFNVNLPISSSCTAVGLDVYFVHFVFYSFFFDVW